MAVPQLLYAANYGNADAQYAIGYMYFNGLGTPVDDVLAIHWLQAAAKQHNHQAILALATINTSLTQPKIKKHKH